MSKQIVATGKMSNLVGMWAFIWNDDILKAQCYIRGKADDSHYIVQAIDGLSGEPNVCKVVELKDMLSWTFYPTRQIADECFKDWSSNKRNRYKTPF